jgi:hypothetical protein
MTTAVRSRRAAGDRRGRNRRPAPLTASAPSTRRQRRDRHFRLADSSSTSPGEHAPAARPSIADGAALRRTSCASSSSERPHADLEGEHVVVHHEGPQSIRGDVARVYADGHVIDHAATSADTRPGVGGSVIPAIDDLVGAAPR